MSPQPDILQPPTATRPLLIQCQTLGGGTLYLASSQQPFQPGLRGASPLPGRRLLAEQQSDYSVCNDIKETRPAIDTMVWVCARGRLAHKTKNLRLFVDCLYLDQGQWVRPGGMTCVLQLVCRNTTRTGMSTSGQLHTTVIIEPEALHYRLHNG